jgi:hypothetical protein
VVEIIQTSPRGAWHQLGQAQEGCSFLKKEPKNFCFLPRAYCSTRDSMKKFFASFFQKRSACLASPGTFRSTLAIRIFGSA